MRTYTQLTQEQRYQISALKRIGLRKSEMAEEIGVHRATIGRELQRNEGERGYRQKQAHENALQRRAKSQPRIKAENWAVVDKKLRQDWSPEQVSGWLNKYHEVRISHEWIYQHILTDQHTGGDLCTHLRCQKKNGANAMESTITAGKFLIGSVLKCVQQLWNSVSGRETGKSTL